MYDPVKNDIAICTGIRIDSYFVFGQFSCLFYLL